MKFIFGSGNSNPSYDLLLWKPCLYLCCLKVNELHIWYRDLLRQQQSIWFFAMETLLPWQQGHMLISLLFEGKWTSHLVHRSLEATATHALTCSHGNPVTMATETYLLNFAVWRLINFIFGTHVPWENSNPLQYLLLWKSCCHGNRDIPSWLCIWKYRSFKISGTYVPWGNNNPSHFMLQWQPCYQGNKNNFAVWR